jgi:cyclohexadieny/prephenate dehydrogenase
MSRPEPLFSRVAYIGCGLINSSLARALAANGVAGHQVAFARTRATRDRVHELGIVDTVADAPDAAVEGADLVVIGTPVSAYGEVAAAIAPGLRPGAVVTDVGSVKTSVIRVVEPHLPDGVHFVPGHPIAGTEKSGPDAGFAELFHSRWCVLTPTPETDGAAVAKVRRMWEAVGMQVDEMDPEHHDRVLAITSHVPHLIAFSIVGTVTLLEEHLQAEVMKYAAGGFRDFTRIAASDPQMWRDIFLSNKDAVLEMVARATEDLASLQRLIRHEDGDALIQLITRTREIRQGVIAFEQD